MEITSKQVQVLQDRLDEAQVRLEKVVKGRPIYELRGTEYGQANYWDGKVAAIIDCLRIFGL